MSQQSTSGDKYLRAHSQEVGSVVNKKGLVKSKGCAFSLCWVGLVPQAPTDGCCGAVVPKLSVQGVIFRGRVRIVLSMLFLEFALT